MSGVFSHLKHRSSYGLGLIVLFTCRDTGVA